MAPKYPTDFLFSIVVTTNKAECFFCDEDIVPVRDFYVVLTTIPGKKMVMQTHDSCFEQLGWSMMNFVFAKRGQMLPDEVIN